MIEVDIAQCPSGRFTMDIRNIPKIGSLAAAFPSGDHVLACLYERLPPEVVKNNKPSVKTSTPGWPILWDLQNRFDLTQVEIHYNGRRVQPGGGSPERAELIKEQAQTIARLQAVVMDLLHTYGKPRLNELFTQPLEGDTLTSDERLAAAKTLLDTMKGQE